MEAVLFLTTQLTQGVDMSLSWYILAEPGM
jgi:hypothetical protein